ncbi:MAG: dependent ligase [Rickettsiaceae bacterium]|jgi:DNA ligase-1|nr:dependent ligase [Rickettsiaceae bacterium]
MKKIILSKSTIAIYKKHLFAFFLSVLFFINFLSPSFAEIVKTSKPEIQLANLYHSGIDVTKYLVSEKLDGVRAYWDGKNLISREGSIFNAPKWFIKDFPSDHLEGELWISRGSFEKLSGIVRKEIPEDDEWKQVHFMLFDMPQHKGIFKERLETMKILVVKSKSKYLQIIPQEKIFSHKELTKQLNEIVKNGGEGLMLHRADSFYQAVRNDDILKLKTFEDAEAVVIGHIAGTGKFTGMMGALLVENKDKMRFKIGTGFSDEQRRYPPKIGSTITYKFFGKTKNNKPRFPSFMRMREEI